MKKTRNYKLTVRYVIIVCALLFAANILLGAIMISRSRSALSSLLNNNMLNITDTAAGFLDGDVLAALTEEDVGSPVFEDIKQKLIVFQNHVNIEFIYAVRQVGEEEFVFTVDPDPVDPGQFGEEVLCTPALIQAGKGIACVDTSPAADRWGNFYSAYSPVFDSKGEVAGIVGIDFDASEYDAIIRGYIILIVIMSICSCLIGGSVVVLMTRRIRKGFNTLSQELGLLSSSVEQLSEEIASNPGFSKAVGSGDHDPSRFESEGTESLKSRDGRLSESGIQSPEYGDDEIAALDSQIRSIQEEIKAYLKYVQDKANTDALTKVGNTTAYHERLDVINEDPSSAYSIVVFDIDHLKQVNDTYGHSCGDETIARAAGIIADVFGAENTYRIGGDEFIVIMNDTPAQEMERKVEEVNALTKSRSGNKAENAAVLSLSAGIAEHSPDSDEGFREVFARADAAMYQIKEIHHGRHETCAVNRTIR